MRRLWRAAFGLVLRCHLYRALPGQVSLCAFEFIVGRLYFAGSDEGILRIFVSLQLACLLVFLSGVLLVLRADRQALHDKIVGSALYNAADLK